MPQPLHVEFCGSVALIECHHPALYNQLARHFQHCGGQATTVVATYRIDTDADGKLTLWRNETLLHPKPTPLFIFLYLARDVVEKLIAHTQSHLVFHAAGLGWGEAGVILCGRSGRGKSTFSTWLTATGFDFLSDEVVAVDPTFSHVWGLACPIILKPKSRFVWEHWLGERAEGEAIQTFDGAAWFDPEAFRPNCVRQVFTPRLVIFPHYKAETPLTAQRLTPGEATIELMHQLVNFDQLPDQGFKTITSFVQQLVAYRLTYDDVQAATAWLQDYLKTTPSLV